MHQDKPLRAHGAFMTRYDVPQRERYTFEVDESGRPHTATGASTGRSRGQAPQPPPFETGDTPDPREPYADLLASSGWDMTVRFVILPYAKRVRQALLKHADLSEGERQRLVGALTTLEHIVEELYKRADEKPPGWVVETFS